jgi:hypothetical protein
VKRPGVQVRARRGYWALTRQEAAIASAPPKPGAPKPIEDALNAVASSVRARIVRTWIGTERGENGKTRVTFAWEPVPKLPGEPARSSEEPARVAVIAAGQQGDPYFRGRVPDAASSPTTQTGAASGAGARVTFDVPPGKMQLRLSVEGAGAEVLDSETRDITIPDLTTPQTSLSTPVILRARTPREMQQLKADPRPMPVISREFSRADRLLIRVAAYGPGDQAPALSARLLSRTGQTMSQLTVSPPDAAGMPPQIELPLAGMAPGDYVLEINATGTGGAAQQLVAFRVTV